MLCVNMGVSDGHDVETDLRLSLHKACGISRNVLPHDERYGDRIVRAGLGVASGGTHWIFCLEARIWNPMGQTPLDRKLRQNKI